MVKYECCIQRILFNSLLEKQKTGFLGSRNVFKMFLFEEVKNICGIETHKTIPDFNEVYEVFSFMTDMNMRRLQKKLALDLNCKNIYEPGNYFLIANNLGEYYQKLQKTMIKKSFQMQVAHMKDLETKINELNIGKIDFLLSQDMSVETVNYLNISVPICRMLINIFIRNAGLALQVNERLTILGEDEKKKVKEFMTKY